jgi:hypothetical protein
VFERAIPCTNYDLDIFLQHRAHSEMLENSTKCHVTIMNWGSAGVAGNHAADWPAWRAETDSLHMCKRAAACLCSAAFRTQ